MNLVYLRDELGTKIGLKHVDDEGKDVDFGDNHPSRIPWVEIKKDLRCSICGYWREFESKAMFFGLVYCEHCCVKNNPCDNEKQQQLKDYFVLYAHLDENEDYQFQYGFSGLEMKLQYIFPHRPFGCRMDERTIYVPDNQGHVDVITCQDCQCESVVNYYNTSVMRFCNCETLDFWLFQGKNYQKLNISKFRIE